MKTISLLANTTTTTMTIPTTDLTTITAMIIMATSQQQQQQQQQQQLYNEQQVYDPYPDLTQIFIVRFIFIFCYAVIMISAALGNLLITYIVISNRKMRTTVNYYIVNLACCDILISVFVLPTKMFELLAPAEWLALNDTWCTIMSFLQSVMVFASLLTLVATCFERYFAIVHPLKSRMQQSKRRTCRILLAVWLLSSFASLPNILNGSMAVINILKSEYGTIARLTCMSTFDDEFRLIYFTILFICLYLIPLALIAFTCFCIARALLRTSILHRQGSLLRQEVNRRKVGKMILVVVVSFTIAWTPYFLISVITQYQKENYFDKHDYYFTMLSINLFGFLHSSINPVIYLTMSARFQKGFMRLLRIVMCCQKSTENAGHTSIPDPGTSSRYSPNGNINNMP
uniref:Cholecystokinin receptor type A-like n=1 Tax=Dermatophagoides pteronyssinus TaxID=6956 RepID=A0A6P6Y3R6_DERPT|nr:cholecystokinin receptor type A-like [Dermatophagoides pteronyssinus]